MNTDDYRDLQNTTLKELLEAAPEFVKKKEVAQAAVAAAYKKLTDEEKIYALTPTEVELLIAFREWSASSGSASGVFHWGKPYGIAEREKGEGE